MQETSLRTTAYGFHPTEEELMHRYEARMAQLRLKWAAEDAQRLANIQAVKNAEKAAKEKRRKANKVARAARKANR